MSSLEGMHVYADTLSLPAHLRPYAREIAETGLWVFHHPVFITIFPVFTSLPIEEVISAKEELRLKELQAGRFSHYLFLTEKPYRLDALLELAQAGEFDSDPAAYWALVGRFWVDSDIDESHTVWSDLLQMDLPGRLQMTSETDRDVLSALPEQVQIWRGFAASSGDIAPEHALGGHSWSLSEDVARRFARSFAGPSGRPALARATLPKDRILALLLGRGEEEVVCFPADVQNVAVEAIRDNPDDEIIPLSDF